MQANSQNKSGSVIFFMSKYRTGMLCLFLLLSFSTFRFIPVLKIAYLPWIGIVFLFLILIYPVAIGRRNNRITKLELYSLLMMLYIPLTSAHMSNSEFGQPWFYGIGTMVPTLLIGNIMILFYLYRRNFFSLADIERALLWLSWLNLSFVILVPIIVDANQFDLVDGFIIGMDGVRKISISNDFLCIGFYYYVFAGNWEKNNKYSLIASLFFIALLLSGGRAGLIALISSYLFFMFRWGSPLKIVKLILTLGIIFILSYSALSVIFPDEVNDRQNKFNDSFTVLFKQEEVGDVSANARVFETEIAFPYIEKHPLMGNGGVSNQWNGGTEALHGVFHPSDIGIVGILYLHGILGLLLFSIQYYFAIQYTLRLPKNGGQHGRLVNALKGYLLYVALTSITTGKSVFFMEQNLLLIAIIYCAGQIENMSINMKTIRR